MTEAYQTPLWSLPLLATAQAQKEATHNEAVTIVDALLMGRAEALGLNAPPASPLAGQMWVVGTAPTGVWAGKAAQLALWTAGGWRFFPARSGMELRIGAARLRARYDGAIWSLPPTLAAVDGGAVIDSQARTAIQAIQSLLVGAGLSVAA